MTLSKRENGLDLYVRKMAQWTNRVEEGLLV